MRIRLVLVTTALVALQSQAQTRPGDDVDWHFDESPSGQNAPPPKPAKKTEPAKPPAPKPAEPADDGAEPPEFAGTLAAHNRYRAQVGVPPLVWSKTVAAWAQSWADHLKETKSCDMQHRPHNKYGENLFWGSGKRYTMTEAVDDWASEKANYHLDTNSCDDGAVCGHYTQVVWKNTKAVGCGMATCGEQMVVVCNYDPPGNYVGQKPY